MLYLVGRALRRLKWNAKIYIFIVMELVVGFTIIASQINVAQAVENRLNEYKQQYTESGISVNAYAKEFSENRKLPVTKEDYDYINEKYGQMIEISYISYGSFLTTGFDTVSVFCMSDSAFQKRFSVSGEKAYIGKEVKSWLENGAGVLGDFAFVISPAGITVDGTECLFEAVEGKKNDEKIISFSSLADSDKTIGESIILPIQLQEALEKQGVFYNCTLELVGREGMDSQKLREIGNEVVVYLSEKHDANTYELANKIAEYEGNSSDLSDTIRVLSWIAKFSLFLVVVGMVGVLFILLERRKRDFIISFWVGAEKWKLVLELLLEMLILCFTAGVVSLIVTFLITPSLGTSQYTVVMSQDAVWMVMILCLVIAVMTGMTSVFRIRIKNARV